MALELFRLEGKLAWITGGTKGLGLEMASALAELGAKLVITSRHEDEARAAAQSLSGKHGVEALGLAADVTKPEDLERVIQRAESLGGVDILLNNAGINIRKPSLELAAEEWRQVLETDLTGPFLCAKAAVPGMKAKGWGRVIHISSALGLIGLAGRPAYTAAKGGLVLLTKTQALEFAPYGITVNAICPGPFATEMNRPLMEDPVKYQDFASKIPLGRWGEMQEIRGPVQFLASHASSYVTGSCLSVDGGWTAY